MGYWDFGFGSATTRGGFGHRRKEFIDLTLSWIAITIAFSADYLLRGYLIGVVLSGLAVGTGFIFHELAHRQVALRYGLYARYRAWYSGLLLAVVMAFSTTLLFGRTFVFAAPGAVYIVGAFGLIPPTIELKVAEAGPLANIGVSIAFFLASMFVQPPWSIYLVFISRVNAILAFFNLLPIPPLDGYKIMRVSSIKWVLLFAASLALFILL